MERAATLSTLLCVDAAQMGKVQLSSPLLLPSPFYCASMWNKSGEGNPTLSPSATCSTARPLTRAKSELAFVILHCAGAAVPAQGVQPPEVGAQRPAPRVRAHPCQPGAEQDSVVRHRARGQAGSPQVGRSVPSSSFTREPAETFPCIVLCFKTDAQFLYSRKFDPVKIVHVEVGFMYNDCLLTHHTVPANTPAMLTKCTG